jgi:hypothetical protein
VASSMGVWLELCRICRYLTLLFLIAKPSLPTCLFVIRVIVPS